MEKSNGILYICMFAGGLTVLTLASTMSGHRALAAINEQDRMTQMGMHIVTLEERVQKVVQQQPPLSDWRVRKNWLRIKIGMSFAQVEQIFGPPTKTSMGSEDIGNWYYEGYSKEAGTTVSGNIFFLNRQVASVSPPVY